MVGSYVSSTKHALRPHAEPQRRQTYTAPRGFSRPTVASRNHSTDKATRRVRAEEEATAQSAQSVDHRVDPVAPPHAASSTSHADAAPLNRPPMDDRLDRDLILSPYWHALRTHGFESGAVLRALSTAQRMEALTLCGIEKLGHRWYVLNKYAASASVPEELVATDEPPTVPPPHPNMRSPYAPTTHINIPPPTPSTDDAATQWLPDGHHSLGTTPPSPSTRGALHAISRRDAPLSGVSEASPPTRATLRRRLLRPRIAQSRRRSPPSPSHHRRSPSNAMDSTVTVDKELLHPPEEDDDGSLPSHAAYPDPQGTPDRPTTTRGARAAPSVPQRATDATPRDAKDGSDALWGAVTAAPITSLHDGAAYKTLVSLLGTAVEPRSHGHRLPAPRRRSTSPGDQSATAGGSSDWVVEAARRRFLASPSSASTTPLTPFFLSR